jgi:hypothetical protein
VVNHILSDLALVTDSVPNIIFIPIFFLFVRLDLFPGLFLFLLFFSFCSLLFVFVLFVRLDLGNFNLDLRQHKLNSTV